MRLLSIDNVKENMRIARNIYSADGRILLTADTQLTSHYIQRLKELGISSLYIIDRLIGVVEVDDLVRIQTRIEATKIIQETLSNVRDSRNVSGEKVYKIINSIIDEILSNRNISFSLVDIRAMNDYLFGHCLTVSILSLMTGILSGYNFSRLKELGVGTILHDVGKGLISDEIINKNGSLSAEEFREVQNHSQYGYDILKKSIDISSVSAHIAWQHHERMDGSGYPRGLKGNEIHEFARIAAVADVYDALTTDRIYRKRSLPHEIIEYIRDESKEKFDPEFTKLFLENIAPFPIGSFVLLNNGEKGVVVKVPKDFPARPVVKVIYDKDDNQIAEPVDQNLKKDLTLFITKVLKDDELLKV